MEPNISFIGFMGCAVQTFVTCAVLTEVGRGHFVDVIEDCCSLGV